MYTHVEHSQIHVLPTQCVYALCILAQTAILSLYSIGSYDGEGVCLLRGARFVRFAAMLRIHCWRNVQCHCHHSQFETLLFSPNSGASPNFSRGAASVVILNCLNLGAGFGGWTRIVCLASSFCPMTSFSHTVAPTSQNDIIDSWIYCCSLSLPVH